MKQLLPSERLLADISKSMPFLASIRESTKDKIVHTGTTSLAIKYKDGVVIAADRRVVAGSMILESDSRKIEIISPFSVVTCAGTVAFIQMVMDILKRHLREYEMENKRPLPLKAQAHVFKAILQRIGLLGFYFQSQLLLAGYDKKPRIFSFDVLGAIYEKNTYEVLGSGTAFAISHLDEHYNPDLTKREAMDLAVRAIERSGKRDVYTEPPQLNPPLVITVDEESISETVYGTTPEEEGQTNG